MCWRQISEEQIANWLCITFVPLRVCLYYLLLKTNIPKKDELTEFWGQLHNEELNDLYPSANIFR